MNHPADHSYEQGILFIAALVVFTSCLMLAQKRLSALVYLFAWQDLLLAIATPSLPRPLAGRPRFCQAAPSCLAKKERVQP